VQEDRRIQRRRKAFRCYLPPVSLDSYHPFRKSPQKW